ncbi:hypothetical protein IFR05_003240 [Cadophora sp. M221]|nr:hypothetical protein IFR05_003240 [Cadophora sp. M221]
MTRHKSKKKAQANMLLNKNVKITIDLEEDRDDSASPPMAKVPAFVEAAQNEQAMVRQEIRGWRTTYRSPEEKLQKKEILRLLEKTAGVLSKVGNEVVLKEFIQHLRLHDPGAVGQIEEHRNTIANLLAPSTFENPERITASVPGTIELYDQTFSYRALDNQLYIVRPIEAIQGIPQRYKRSKVIGFVEHRGRDFPLMYALPGWTSCSEDHPNVLDSELWTALVSKWAAQHNWSFRASPYDQGVLGRSIATHVEPRLVLWYALFSVQEHFGLKGSYQFLLGELWRLKNCTKKLKAVIYLSEAPCKPCKEFIEYFEGVHDISYEVRVMKNLGQLRAKRTKDGSKKYSSLATDSEVSDSDEEAEMERQRGEEEAERNKQERADKEGEKSRIEVVIRPKPSSESLQTRPQSTSTPAFSQKLRIRKFHYRAEGSHSEAAINVNSDESDESDYGSSLVRRRQRLRSKTPNQGGYENEPITPDESPFGAEARRQAKLFRKAQKKRKARLEEPSPSAAKKFRHTRFS